MYVLYEHPTFFSSEIRREKGNCRICWIPVSAMSDFQVSGQYGSKVSNIFSVPRKYEKIMYFVKLGNNKQLGIDKIRTL